MNVRQFGLKFLALALGLAFAGTAEAQSIDCARLRGQISAASSGGNSAKAGQYGRAAARQRSEIDRTEAYAQSIGCENRQFLFFGSSAPPQCGAIKARISAMKANFNALQNAAENASGAGRKAELLARYDSYCRERPQQAAVQPTRGLFETLFNSPVQPESDQPMQDEPLQDAGDKQDAHPRGGREAICVRLADGGFFPVSYSARRSQLDDLADLCSKLCPGTEAKLFTWNPNGDLKDAIDLDGNSYAELPNALKFETKFVPEAACRPADKSWAQVLGPAEEVLGAQSKHDILVTEAKAAELSRVKDTSALASLVKKKKTQASADTEADAFTASLATATAGPVLSSGIGGGTASSGPLFKQGEGELREIIGPDGIKRKVRIIAPML